MLHFLLVIIIFFELILVIIFIPIKHGQLKVMLGVIFNTNTFLYIIFIFQFFSVDFISVGFFSEVPQL